MTLDQLLKQKIIMVTANNKTCITSTPEQIKDAILNDWKVNKNKIANIDYIIGLRAGVGIGCFKIKYIIINKETNKVSFEASGDLSHIVNNINFKEMGIRKGHKEIQYLNIK